MAKLVEAASHGPYEHFITDEMAKTGKRQLKLKYVRSCNSEIIISNFSWSGALKENVYVHGDINISRSWNKAKSWRRNDCL